MRAELGFDDGDRWQAFAALSAKDFGDLEAGDGTGLQPQTGYDENNVDLKLSYSPDPGQGIHGRTSSRRFGQLVSRAARTVSCIHLVKFGCWVIPLALNLKSRPFRSLRILA